MSIGAVYVQNEYWVAVFQLVMAMLGMGATLKLSDFGEIIKEPKAFTTGTITQLLLVPLVAWGLIQVLGVTGGVAVGIALIAAIPGGTASNIFTYLARGNIALSIAITAVTTLLCLATTPVVLGTLIADYMPESFSMPTVRIMKEIGLTLLLPLALGMLVLRQFPNWASSFSTWCIRGSILGLLAIVAGSAAAGRFDAESFGGANILSIAVVTVAFFTLGRVIPVLLRLPIVDTTAIEIEIGFRNINLGVMINASLFPVVAGRADPVGTTVLLSLVLYGMLSLLLSVGLVLLRRRRGAPAAAS